MDKIITKKIERFLFNLGYKSIDIVGHIKSGRNSRVYKLKLDKKYVVLKFFLDKNRSKIKREYLIYNYFNKMKIKNVVKPIGFNYKNNFAIYPYLVGKNLKKISTLHINKATRFINNINKNKKLSKIPLAVEGIFNRKDHIKICESRINKMKLIKKNSLMNKKLFLFLNNKIIPKYEKIKKELYNDNVFKNLKYKLSKDQMMISPSDFGFHNIIESKGELFFYDFEYAGFDDPVKFICDFYCQPDQRISLKQKEIFKDKILIKNKYHKELSYLIIKFLPLHQIKWCCIILNEFKNNKLKIKKLLGQNYNDSLQSQLIKAKNYFKKNLEAK